MRAVLPLLLALPLAAHELYVAEGFSEAALGKALASLPGAESWVRVVLPDSAANMEEARVLARAMEAGVTSLPSVVLCDGDGAYAVLPLAGLTPDKLAEAEALAGDEGRAEATARRRFDAAVYLLCATLTQPSLDDGAVAAAIAECRRLLASGLADEETRQFLGLRCLYPLLMMQYARAYAGAHTPRSEAKLLEAIAALEAARDLNRESKLGKDAHAERERLRTARRKSRQYE